MLNVCINVDQYLSMLEVSCNSDIETFHLWLQTVVLQYLYEVPTDHYGFITSIFDKGVFLTHKGLGQRVEETG